MLSRLFALLLFCIMPAALFAQTIFQNLRWQDGLSAKQVRCLYKDNAGFLWIGTTNGLNRFDGAVIKQYKSGANLRNLYINAIQPIKCKDTLMIGSRKGVLMFDKRRGTFARDSRFDVLKDEVIETIRADDKGRIWIATAGSSRIFIFQNGKLSPITTFVPAARIIEKPDFFLSAMVWDTLRKGFWIAGNRPYFIDLENKKVYHKANNPLHVPLLNTTNVYAIAVDRQSNIWYGNDNDPSINFWNCKTGALETVHTLDGIKINEGCNKLFIDHKNRLWISSWLFASFVKEPGLPIKKLAFGQTDAYTIGYGFFRDAIEDSDGSVWLGTINGVSKSQSKYPLQAIYRLPSFNFFLETGFSHANHISVEDNLIMASKEDGVIAYDMKTRTFERYLIPGKKRHRFLMSARAGDTWWFAADSGLYYLSAGKNKLAEFTKMKENLPEKYVNFVFSDRKGRVWFHIINDALYRYDPVSGKTDRFDGKDPSHGLFSFANCQSFIQLRDGNFLFSLNGRGFLKFNGDSEQFSEIAVPGKNEFYVSRLIEDKGGNVWASAAGRGMLKVNTKGVLIDSVDTSKGLLYDHLSGMGMDDRGIIWASSREGLMFYNPVTKAITKVEIDLAKTLQDYWNNLTVANGKIYAVMLDHVVVIDPFRFSTMPVKRPPHLTSVKIFGTENTDFVENGTLELKPDEDYITFQYASLSHRDISSLQYSFQLTGIDKGWVNAGRSLTASYTNLLPGNYTFKVRSTDENGNWMTEITSLKVIVKPHWWQTWWFIWICIFIAVLSVFLFYTNMRMQKRKRRIEKTIDYFANSVYGENSVNEICWDIARNCISQLRFQECSVYLLDPEKNRLVLKAAYGPHEPKGLESVSGVEVVPGIGLVGSVFEMGKPSIVRSEWVNILKILHRKKDISELAVPILDAGKVIGVIYSKNKGESFFREDHVKALTTIASISANKIAEAIAEAQAQEKEMMLLEISKMLAESQLMALRAQMNPHFIFNCLNSIQECIVTEKYGEASMYLNKFSKLFRMVLNNSDKALISVEEEKKVLELYLELEQMRFEENFSFEIILDQELEDDEIVLPSMLVQPYVENALWHGLMHKTGERKLTIEFSRIGEDKFKCSIEDNGIGRKKSFELKHQTSKSRQHVSKGLRISKDRLDLIQRQGNHSNLRITDKYDADGKATGTLVEIELSAYLTGN